MLLDKSLVDAALDLDRRCKVELHLLHRLHDVEIVGGEPLLAYLVTYLETLVIGDGKIGKRGAQIPTFDEADIFLGVIEIVNRPVYNVELVVPLGLHAGIKPRVERDEVRVLALNEIGAEV